MPDSAYTHNMRRNSINTTVESRLPTSSLCVTRSAKCIHSLKNLCTATPTGTGSCVGSSRLPEGTLHGLRRQHRGEERMVFPAHQEVLRHVSHHCG